jgi:GntR family transcriptional regulator
VAASSSGGLGAPRPLDRGARQPLWAQVEADLRRRLDEGEFSSSFPGEHALVGEYGVSRHTVRQALRSLRADGLVTARRGRESRLGPAAEIEQPLGVLYSLFASVEAAGEVQRSVVRALDVRADRVVASRLGLEESTPLLHLERLRLAAGEPLAVDRVWLPAAATAALLDIDFSRTSLYGELARRCGVRLSGGRERLRAVVPSPAEARLLGVGPQVAALAIDRLGSTGEGPFEWRQTLVRGDRFAVTATLSAHGYRLDTDPRGVGSSATG